MSAKDLILRPIPAPQANDFVRRHHYSGKVATNSQLHIGVFLNGALEGALQFGPSIDKRRMCGLVQGTGWNEFLELNRMAFTPALPRNSESRALAVACRLLRKYVPHVKWIVTFADATQCGDGTIYRAAGFLLTQIKRNQQILDWNGRRIAKKTLDNENYPKPGGKYYSRVLIESGEATALPGFQIRYVKFLDDGWRSRLTCPVLPYSAIVDAGASMYKGERKADSGRADSSPSEVAQIQPARSNSRAGGRIV